MFSTENLVKKVLANTLNFSDDTSIRLDHRLRDDLALDSMGSLMLLMKLEENIDGFFVDLETFEMRDIETVSSIVKYIDMQMLSKDVSVH